MIPERHPSRTPPARRSSWWKLLVAGSCRRCGAAFLAPAATKENLPAFCSTACQRKLGKLRRRVRSREVQSEPYKLTEIAERDRGLCQLCGEGVAMNLAVPHPKAPTVDHIIPLSQGGDDLRANVQLAHFLCNSRKGAKGSQQLALFG
ncbi:HNH endonuclease [Nocardiopsis exhalans]|uniref:HNH endonuclease n=1 Tax=Nocardiopsis exhalans TaxID=163604 RepID=UPI0034158DD0